ncbi:hypothetical protein GMA11_03330 [Granulicatella sp. zg-ZJ]|uniref:tyrosine-type recombinase/integrase n=1 Tax=Granulicatella sp. zg-ZJ TaxID=2678504 RepID=UPI0013D0264E|nr:site-specific integrase [Granulicatella sp. zg-ZJ]MBS4749609.1 site-specific integrase [Carnobacteriaceae bacterium zg-ZUI78]NEW62420.1 hypothetical protein [Granulicatella sp. zg-ZJ]
MEHLKEYLKQLNHKQYNANYIRTIELEIKRFLEFSNCTSFSQIDSTVCCDYYDFLIKTYSKSTIRQKTDIIRKYYLYLRQENIITSSIYRLENRFKGYKPTNRLPVGFFPDEFNQLLYYIKFSSYLDSYQKFVFFLFCVTGISIEEALSLQIKHICFEKLYFYFEEKNRYILFSSELKELMQQYLIEYVGTDYIVHNEIYLLKHIFKTGKCSRYSLRETFITIRDTLLKENKLPLHLRRIRLTPKTLKTSFLIYFLTHSHFNVRTAIELVNYKTVYSLERYYSICCIEDMRDTYHRAMSLIRGKNICY